MLRTFAFTILIFAASYVTLSQDLLTYDQTRVDRQKKGMMILGSWAALNIAYSPFAARNSSGSNKYFHQMNGYWNAVNLVIAGAGYLGAKSLGEELTLGNLLIEQGNMEKILLFNAALDLGYMVGGAYLIERSRRGEGNTNRMKGFGQSIILQGGFLFLFDVAMYAWMHQNHLQIIDLTNQISLNAGLSGVTLTYKL